MYPYAGAQMGFPADGGQPQMFEPYGMPYGKEQMAANQAPAPYYMPYESYGMAPGMMPMSMGPNAAPGVMPMSMGPNAEPSVLPATTNSNAAPSVLPAATNSNAAPSVLPTATHSNAAPSVLPAATNTNAAPVIQPYQFQPYDNGKPQFAPYADDKQGYVNAQPAVYPYGEYMNQSFSPYAENGAPGAYPMTYAPMADGFKPGFYPPQGYRDGEAYYTGYGYQPAFPTPYPVGSYGTQPDPANPYSPMLTSRADQNDEEAGEAAETASAPKAKSAPRKSKSGGKASLHSVSHKPKRSAAKTEAGNSPWINQYR